MPDYKTMYFRMFNSISDAIELLKQAQMDGEDIFTSTSGTPVDALFGLQRRNKEESQEN